ncbi:DUF3304 domain-containing protein [Pseudomonas sp. R5(2019)]|nr:DUF3304 domain-containing protein [Pseudomonas sp. R5(2019)]
MLSLVLAGCDSREDSVSAGLTGIDHLPDHLSVQNFSLNGTGGFQAGKGGSEVCCVSLPRSWRPDLTAVVQWNVTNWRDCGWESYERRVPVEPYEKVGHAWVHFMGDGSVRVVSSDIGPGIRVANTDYPGPHDPIPQKHPWDVYGSWASHCPPQDQPIVMERLQ